MKLRPKIRFLDRNKNRFTVPVHQLKRLTGRDWFDLDYSFISQEKSDPFLRKFLIDPLAITKSLEIRYMNDVVGYGLFAAENITKDTIIGFISGELKKIHSSEVNFDIKNPTALIESGQVSYDDDGNIYIIDSSKKSNHTHYIQHLPSTNYLVALGIKSSIIATNNLSEYTLQYEGFDLTFFRANRDIEIGEIIGCPYQNNSDEMDMNRYSFFSKKGKMLNNKTIIDSSNNADLITGSSVELVIRKN